jgi:hypothetical protein
MVALVATAVSMIQIHHFTTNASSQIYAGISEFLSGDSKTDFSASLYADAYNRHIKTLSDIKTRNPRAYHVLMATLFNECWCVCQQD